MKKFLSALLASAMLFTAVAAAPIADAPDSQKLISAPALAQYGEISFAEFIRAVVVAYDGKEQPQIMDTHYAMPYVLRAEILGLIAKADGTAGINKWNENISREDMNTILAKAAKLENANPEKILAAVNALLVEKIVINGKTIDCPITHRNGSVMLPVRAISEALGYTVTWNQAEYTATVNTGKIKSNVSMGQNLYSYSSVNAIGMSKPTPMASSPLLIDNTTYVPLDFFNLIATATVENGTITVK